MNYLRILAWIPVVGIVVATVVPATDRLETGLEHNYEHLLAFGLVGFVFTLTHSYRPTVLLVSSVVFALMLELAQIPLPTRHARLIDLLVDAFGACLGVWLGYLAKSIWRSFVG